MKVNWNLIVATFDVNDECLYRVLLIWGHTLFVIMDKVGILQVYQCFINRFLLELMPELCQPLRCNPKLMHEWTLWCYFEVYANILSG